MGAAEPLRPFSIRKELYHGRIFRAYLENQQTELDGHDSKTAEMQTLQAKLIRQHEQKKAAAAAEVTSKEPVAE